MSKYPGLSASFGLALVIGCLSATPDALASDFASGGGKVTTDFGASSDWGQSIAVQPDGKILVAGSSYNGSDYDFALARYNADGSLDASFGAGGKVTTAIGSGEDGGSSVALQPDGKIVVAGYTWNGSSYNFALVRYSASGALDTGFDTDGKVTTDFGGNRDYGQGVAVQPDGKVVVAGNSIIDAMHTYIALARYNADGSLDTSFDADGKLLTDFGASFNMGQSVTLQADGKILVTGSASDGGYYDYALVRYNTDGSLDTGFNSNGMVSTDFSSSTDQGFGITLQPDGRILAAGVSWSGGVSDFSLARYNTDGSLDSGFGAGGKVVTDLGGDEDFGIDVAVQPDGKVLVAGSSGDGLTNYMALARYNTNGSLDAGFGANGKVITVVGQDAQGNSIAVQSDGKILVAGDSWSGSSRDFTLVRYNTDGSQAGAAPFILALPGSGGGTVEITAPIGVTFIALPKVGTTVPVVPGVKFTHGTISYKVSSAAGGSVTTKFKFTPALAPTTVLYKVAPIGAAALIPASSWTRADTGTSTTISLTVQDGGAFDLDRAANGVIANTLAFGTRNNVDLVVNSISTASTSVQRGASITINNAVANSGTTATTVPGFKVQYYLSADATITAKDKPVGSRMVSSLAAGAGNSAATVVTIPKTLAPGAYYLGAIVDSANVQPETNETNNARASVGILTVR